MKAQQRSIIMSIREEAEKNMGRSREEAEKNKTQKEPDIDELHFKKKENVCNLLHFIN